MINALMIVNVKIALSRIIALAIIKMMIKPQFQFQNDIFCRLSRNSQIAKSYVCVKLLHRITFAKIIYC